VRAQVIVLAGPSGAGKTHLAERLELPILRLDDFYKNGDDPTLPRIDLAGGEPIVDWDHHDSWNSEAAVAAVEELCSSGCTDAPVYDIALNSRTGHRVLDLGDSAYFLAEGIFAQEIVGECRRRGLLADAFCVTHHPAVTFVRRLTRDLREHRKPPFVLVRRGLHLLLAQRALVAAAEKLGCRVVTPEAAYREITAATATPPNPPPAPRG
jgi:uridine kinase